MPRPVRPGMDKAGEGRFITYPLRYGQSTVRICKFASDRPSPAPRPKTHGRARPACCAGDPLEARCRTAGSRSTRGVQQWGVVTFWHAFLIPRRPQPRGKECSVPSRLAMYEGIVRTVGTVSMYWAYSPVLRTGKGCPCSVELRHSSTTLRGNVGLRPEVVGAFMPMLSMAQ